MSRRHLDVKYLENDSPVLGGPFIRVKPWETFDLNAEPSGTVVIATQIPSAIRSLACSPYHCQPSILNQIGYRILLTLCHSNRLVYPNFRGITAWLTCN